MAERHVATDESQERIDQIYNLQRNARYKFKNTGVKDRRRQLSSLRKAILNHRMEIKEALAKDFQKAHFETDLTELYPVVQEIKHIETHLDHWMRPQEVPNPLTYLGSTAKIHCEAKGNILMISPWNYPFYLTMYPLVMALATGNTALLKPSEFTPHINEVIRKLLSDIFDEEQVALVNGGKEVASYLLKKKFDHIHFTGSTTVGKIVMSAAAEQLTAVTLELGGKSPTVVDRHTNVSLAAEKIAWAKCLNAGQTCIAPDYILVHEDIQEEFTESLNAQLNKLYNGHLTTAETTGIIHKRHFDRLKEMGNQDQSGWESGKLSMEWLDVKDIDDPSMKEEIFGPVLPVMTFKDREQVVETIRSMNDPLAMYIFSNKQSNVDYWIQETHSGGVCINDAVLHISHPYLPFGGINHSGMGRSSGIFGFQAFSNIRPILKQPLRFSIPRLLYPPYNSWKEKLMDFTLRWL